MTALELTLWELTVILAVGLLNIMIGIALDPFAWSLGVLLVLVVAIFVQTFRRRPPRE